MKEELRQARRGQPFPSFADYKNALKICMKTVRFNEHIFKSNSKRAPLPVLDYAVSRLAKTYITWFIFVIGLALFMKLGYSGFGAPGAAIAIVAWILLAGLVITPLIYAFVTPRPIEKYFIHENDMNEEEKASWHKHKSKDLQMERLKKRYGKMARFDD